MKGGNLLTHQPTIEALVEASNVEDRSVVEIGGGTGNITRTLMEKASELTVLETDPSRASKLEAEFPEASIRREDFRDVNFDFERAVGNIPFQHSKEAIRKLGEAQIQSTLIVQDEFADKVVAEPGDDEWGSTSVLAQYFFVPVKLRTVPSRHFRPEPQVDAAIIRLMPNRERHGLDEGFLEFASALLNHTPKKTRNAFEDASHRLGIEDEKAKSLKDEIPFSEERINQLSIRELGEIYRYVNEK